MLAVSDVIAPEHLETHTLDPECFAARLTNYGSLFVPAPRDRHLLRQAIGTSHVIYRIGPRVTRADCGWRGSSRSLPPSAAHPTARDSD
jgi:histidinol dehydrogenase